MAHRDTEQTQAEQAQILLKLVEMDLKFREEHKWWETQLQKGTRLDEFETRFPMAVAGGSEPSRLTGNEWGQGSGLIDSELVSSYLISSGRENYQRDSGTV
jgi:hypothetical protein